MKRGTNEFISRHRLLFIAGVVCIILIVSGVAALLTLTIEPDQPGITGVSLPYSTTFHVSLPEGEKLTVGSLDILALQTGDQMALKIGGHHEDMTIGEEREIADRNATITMLGQRVFETSYRLDATWNGMAKEQALFTITLKTSRQVPDWLISRVLPKEILATPA